jgi:hypothetical protein
MGCAWRVTDGAARPTSSDDGRNVTALETDEEVLETCRKRFGMERERVPGVRES